MLLLEGGLRQVLLIGVRSIGFLARERNMTGHVGMFVDAVAASDMIQHPTGVAQFLDQFSNRVRHRPMAQTSKRSFIHALGFERTSRQALVERVVSTRVFLRFSLGGRENRADGVRVGACSLRFNR